MTKKIIDPVQCGLDSICGGNDAAIGRVFGVSRQSIGQWRKYSSIPRHYMRAFCELTGLSMDTLLEYDEVMKGINIEAYMRGARSRWKKESR